MGRGTASRVLRRVALANLTAWHSSGKPCRCSPTPEPLERVRRLEVAAEEGVRLGLSNLDVVGLHAAAVEDAEHVGHGLAVLRGDARADEGVHFLRLLRVSPTHEIGRRPETSPVNAASSSRGARFEPGDEGSATPADPSGPVRSESLRWDEAASARVKSVSGSPSTRRGGMMSPSHPRRLPGPRRKDTSSRGAALMTVARRCFTPP